MKSKKLRNEVIEAVHEEIVVRNTQFSILLHNLKAMKVISQSQEDEIMGDLMEAECMVFEGMTIEEMKEAFYKPEWVES